MNTATGGSAWGMPLEIVSNLASKDSDSLHEQMHAERSCTSTSVCRSVIAVCICRGQPFLSY